MIITGTYSPVGPAAFETWFWIHSIIRATKEQLSVVLSVSENAEDLRRAARDVRDKALAERLERQAAKLDRDPPRRRGQRQDPRRAPGSGGLGGFILGLNRYDMSYDDIVELIYHAPHDWHPIAPLTREKLEHEGWLGADDQDDGDSDAARRRLNDELRQLVSREAKAQGVPLPRGGRRK